MMIEADFLEVALASESCQQGTFGMLKRLKVHLEVCSLFLLLFSPYSVHAFEKLLTVV